MAWNRLSNYKTVVLSLDDMMTVTYHSTNIVRWDDNKIILQSGGHTTATTKKKMNQTSYQFDLGYHVFQKDWKWFVDYNGETLEFNDDMELAR